MYNPGGKKATYSHLSRQFIFMQFENIIDPKQFSFFRIIALNTFEISIEENIRFSTFFFFFFLNRDATTYLV